jgi:hypothetical protein
MTDATARPGAEDCALDRAEPVEATLRDLHERVLTIEASLGLPISIADKLIACESAKRRWVDPGEARRRRLGGPFDTTAYVSMSGRLAQLLSLLGLKRQPRDVTPTLQSDRQHTPGFERDKRRPVHPLVPPHTRVDSV